jgi:hypothetical protein
MIMESEISNLLNQLETVRLEKHEVLKSNGPNLTKKSCINLAKQS